MAKGLNFFFVWILLFFVFIINFFFNTHFFCLNTNFLFCFHNTLFFWILTFFFWIYYFAFYIKLFKIIILKNVALLGSHTTVSRVEEYWISQGRYQNAKQNVWKLEYNISKVVTTEAGRRLYKNACSGGSGSQGSASCVAFALLSRQ